MHDFPPAITAWTPGSSEKPRTDSPLGFLRWLLGAQKDLVVVGCLLSVVWSLPAALTPWIFGRAIDEGIVPGDSTRLGLWAGLLLVVTVGGAAVGVFNGGADAVLQVGEVVAYGCDVIHPRIVGGGRRPRPARCRRFTGN